VEGADKSLLEHDPPERVVKNTFAFVAFLCLTVTAHAQVPDELGRRMIERRADSNWVPTDPKRGFELMFRLYAPKKEFFDKVWVLPDVEKFAAR
jgi:hypothetical protein